MFNKKIFILDHYFILHEKTGTCKCIFFTQVRKLFVKSFKEVQMYTSIRVIPG